MQGTHETEEQTPVPREDAQSSDKKPLLLQTKQQNQRPRS